MLSVIMPAYNESLNVDKTIRKSVEVLSRIGQDFEVILVDDGSKDDTYQKALDVSKEYPEVRVLGYRPNMGKGYALKYGSRFAKGDLILFLDADLDLPPSQIPLFLDYMRKERADVVIGSKKHPLSKLNYPVSRRFLSKGYSLLLRFMFNLNVTDTQVGIKLFRRKVLERVIPAIKINRFAFDLELLATINQAKFKIVEAPVEIDFHFGSRVNLRQICRMFTDTLNLYYRMKLRPHHSEPVNDKSMPITESQFLELRVLPGKPEQTQIAPAGENYKGKSV